MPNILDAQITAEVPNANSGRITPINVDGQDPHAHCLIKFLGMFGDKRGQVRQGEVIISATLGLYVTDTGDPLEIYRLIEDWTESAVTWNNRTKGERWRHGGADGPGSRAGPSTRGDCSATGWRMIDVTPIVQAWSDGAPNYGMLLKPTGTGGVDFQSREGPGSQSPILKVRFGGQPSGGRTRPGANALGSEDTIVRLTDGRIERIRAEEVKFENPSQAGIRGRAGGRTVFFSGNDVWQIQFDGDPVPPGTSEHLWLADGTRLAGRLNKWNRTGGISVSTDLFGNTFLQRDMLTGVTRGCPPPPRLPVGVKGKDVFWTSDGDRMLGRLLSIGESTIDFRSDLGSLSSPHHRLKTLVFALGSPKERKVPRWVLEFANGDRVCSDAWTIHSDGSLDCRVGGSRRKTRASLLRRAVHLDTRAVVFSRIQPDRYTMRPLLAGTRSITVDCGPGNGPLRLGDRDYLFGLFLRPVCETDYVFDEGFQYFLADLGLSSQLAPTGAAKVAFAVGDGAWKTFTLDKKDQATPIALALNGSRRLRIRVEPTDDWGAGAHVVLGEPVLIRQK